MATAASALPTRRFPIGAVVLLAGLALVILPTMSFVARESWSGEAGGHGPIVLVTGLWLLYQLWPEAKPVVRPAAGWKLALLLAVFLPLYVVARITQIVEVEGYLMYATVLTIVYAMIGAEAMRRLWFPFFYMTFMFPPPDTIVWAVTAPMKILISQGAIKLLYAFGYPIGGAGVTIQVGQFQLLVAAACSGLNSIVALTAISLFYVYMRHQANWLYALMLAALILPVAIFANYVRVLILILLTYHAGEAVAQGFLHNFAGLTMFAVALLTIFGLDSVIEPFWRRAMQKRKAIA